MNMRITLKLYQQTHQWFSKCVSRPAATTAYSGSFWQTQILKPLTYWVRALSGGAYQSESQPGLQVILMGPCGSSCWESWGCKGGSQDWHHLGVCETRRLWSSPHISYSRICMLAGVSALSIWESHLRGRRCQILSTKQPSLSFFSANEIPIL